MWKNPCVVAAMLVSVSIGAAAGERANWRAAGAVLEERRVAIRASGTFEVKMTPQGAEDKAENSTLGRATLDKTFSGDLQGTSVGQMLTALTDTKTSAGYVAIERVTGTLHGKKGGFVLQHSGLMDRGSQRLTIVVVPDSGTGELRGITGTMSIIIAAGKHSFEFDYSIKAE